MKNLELWIIGAVAAYFLLKNKPAPTGTAQTIVPVDGVGMIYDTTTRTAYNPVAQVYTNMDTGALIWQPGM